jgi:hypothetical protein
MKELSREHCVMSTARAMRSTDKTCHKMFCDKDGSGEQLAIEKLPDSGRVRKSE